MAKGLSALERIEQACSMAPIRYQVELPNGDVLEFWATPLTLDARAKAKAACKTDDPMEFAVRLFIQKAKDEAGTPLFTVDAYHRLRRLPKKVIDQFLEKLLDEGESDEEAFDMKSPEEGAATEQEPACGIGGGRSKGVNAGAAA
jgi:hypothetical protein